MLYLCEYAENVFVFVKMQGFMLQILFVTQADMNHSETLEGGFS